jgi:hypothetical protein
MEDISIVGNADIIIVGLHKGQARSTVHGYYRPFEMEGSGKRYRSETLL